MITAGASVGSSLISRTVCAAIVTHSDAREADEVPFFSVVYELFILGIVNQYFS